MPSATYYRRQAELCLRLALVAADVVAAQQLLDRAEQFNALADVTDEREMSSDNSFPESDSGDRDSRR